MTRPKKPWDEEKFTAKLRAVGVLAYHDKHPFHVSMNEGKLSRDALRHCVANRFYYQRNLPQKDAAILSNCPLREVRQMWLHRITDHDGADGNEGGDAGLTDPVCSLSPNRALVDGILVEAESVTSGTGAPAWIKHRNPGEPAGM